MIKFPFRSQFVRLSVVVLSPLLVASVPASAAKEPHTILVEPARGSEPGGPHVSKDLSGVFQTQEHLVLRLNTDLGSVRVLPLERGASPTVRYSVHVETDARGAVATQLLDHYVLTFKNTAAGVDITGNLPQQLAKGSNGAQFWVHFEVTVPASYSVEVATGVGDILTSDIGGTAKLVTEGGNIVTGRIAMNLGQATNKRNAPHSVAKLETQGGHIQVDDVAGDLTAFTAGGHINTGFISGMANLHSGGGHIRAAGIGGKSELATEGGNITVGKAGTYVAVKTGGGQIDFGEVRGSVHALTGGGGIRVMYVTGPMDVESSGGSICLTRVSGSVRAETSYGTITAWINPESSPNANSSVRLSGPSQLSSGAGDLVVFLPRNLAANIEAVVENGGAQRIEADPALALQMGNAAPAGGAVKAIASLNGGGPLIRLKTTGGKIRLQYLDSETGLWNSMMRDQKARMEREFAPVTPVADRGAVAPKAPGPPTAWPSMMDTPEAPQPPEKVKRSELESSWRSTLELHILGGVREDGDDFLKRIVSAPRPAYPDVARKAGIEGIVRLQVRLTQDGKIEVQKLLEGDTLLADAAIAAVRQWHGKPAWLDGKPVDVFSTVSFEFHLH